MSYTITLDPFTVSHGAERRQTGVKQASPDKNSARLDICSTIFGGIWCTLVDFRQGAVSFLVLRPDSRPFEHSTSVSWARTPSR